MTLCSNNRLPKNNIIIIQNHGCLLGLNIKLAPEYLMEDITQFNYA